MLKDIYSFPNFGLISRILGQGPNGFRCLIGCGAGGNSGMILPRSIHFDSHGNLLVMDSKSGRLLKFLLLSNSCGKSKLIFTRRPEPFDSLRWGDHRRDAQHRNHLSLRGFPFLSFDIFFESNNDGNILQYFEYSLWSSSALFKRRNMWEYTLDDIRIHLSMFIFVHWKWMSIRSATLSIEYLLESRFDRFFFMSVDMSGCLGRCYSTVDQSFLCRCANGWEGEHCERQVGPCRSVRCLNGGVCQSSFLNYTCKCLGQSHSGRHCEIPSSKTILLQRTSKSSAGIAIAMIISVAALIVTMDVFKYALGIDPAKEELEKSQQKKKKKKKKVKGKRTIMVIRYLYVHSSSQPPEN